MPTFAAVEPSPAIAPQRAPGLPLRLALLGILYIAELIAISVWLDTGSLARTAGLTGLMGDWGPIVVRAAVVFAVVFATFGFLRSRPVLDRVSAQVSQFSISRTLLAGHFAAMAIFGLLSHRLFGTGITGLTADFTTALWMAVGIGGGVMAALAFVPLEACVALIRGTGSLWLLASLASGASIVFGKLASKLWAPTTELTYHLVAAMLRPMLTGMIANPVTHQLGTHKFNVTISPQCSGLEGAGLMLVFSVLWLWLFRQECRFPQALLLIPISVGTLWVINLVRIAALIMIGNAGAAEIAIGGFHSQAGWIAFNAVALTFSVVARRVQWLNKAPVAARLAESRTANPAAAYLIPFLTILAAAMLSRAASAGFELLYPLRFIAAVAVLWIYRATYRNLDWRVGWMSPAVGIAVFAMWLGLDRVLGSTPDRAMAAGLAALPFAARMLWLIFRTLAATVTVPIAEELAFRGFLIRRVMSVDFEALNAKSFTWIALVVSSLAFGSMHGGRWIAGTVAGSLYAWVYLRRGRIGDAVLAHATTNALLAAWVLSRGDWGLW